jgi:hypothetical protein
VAKLFKQSSPIFLQHRAFLIWSLPEKAFSALDETRGPINQHMCLPCNWESSSAVIFRQYPNGLNSAISVMPGLTRHPGSECPAIPMDSGSSPEWQLRNFHRDDTQSKFLSGWIDEIHYNFKYLII